MTEIADVFGSEGLANRVAIYVPRTVGVDGALDAHTAEQYVEFVLSELSRLFGSATAVTAECGWLSQSSDLVTQQVTIVYSFTPQLDRASLITIRHLCRTLQWKLSQEGIVVEINGRLLFVE